jgi:Uma2 family endonuclease/predicted RNase H-like HicB family nuclease
MNTNSADSWIERHIAEMPEGKLELIDGKLIISTEVGSRRILFELLRDYGPHLVLPFAPPSSWWQALQDAYAPQPPPTSASAHPRLAQWHEWADRLAYEPTAAPAGPKVTSGHQRLHDILQWGLYHFGECSGRGREFGRDFVIRLGENGLTPDILFVDRARLAFLRERYLDGPPALAIEIVTSGSMEQDRRLKRDLYEQAGIPEYWLVQPDPARMTFYRLGDDGRYQPWELGPAEIAPIVESDEDRRYASVAVPGLSLSLRDLWRMTSHDVKDPWRPFLPVAPDPDAPARLPLGDGGIQWDEIPFQPRVDLQPVPIRFDEYASWCGRAKFERYGGGLKIDGTEGTRRVAGMLLMTFGLTEVVRLAHPRDWLAFLDRERHEAAVRRKTEAFLLAATYDRREYPSEGPYYWGEIPQLPDLSGYGDSLEACRLDLESAVENWVRLRIARREPIAG